MIDEIAAAAAPVTTEVTPIVEKSPEDIKLAETFQRINKQETHLKSERQKIDEARKAFEAEKAKAEKYSSLEGKDPFEILEHFGISYERLLEADKAKRNPIAPEVKKALDRVSELESKILSKEEEATKERRAKAELQIKADIQKTIKDNEFDILEIAGAEQSVVEYMEEIYNQTGEIIDYKDACQAVAENLAEQYHKLSKSKFVQPKVSAPVIEEEKAPTAMTLTNKMVQSIPTKPKILNEAERMKAALQALNAQR